MDKPTPRKMTISACWPLFLGIGLRAVLVTTIAGSSICPNDNSALLSILLVFAVTHPFLHPRPEQVGAVAGEGFDAKYLTAHTGIRSMLQRPQAYPRPLRSVTRPRREWETRVAGSEGTAGRPSRSPRNAQRHAMATADRRGLRGRLRSCQRRPRVGSLPLDRTQL